MAAKHFMIDQKPSDALGHTLQTRHVTMIALGGVIGAGLFVGTGSTIRAGGPGVVLAYGACGLLVLLVMRMLGEMAVAQPGRGSFAEYAALALGPWAGFTIRWLYWYSWVFTVGAETVAGAKLLHEAGFPAPVWVTGLGLVVAMTAVNLVSVRSYGEIEFWFASIKVAAIAAFVVTGVAFVSVLGAGPQRAMATLVGYGGWLPRGWGGLLGAMPVVLFSMLGSESVTIAAAESQDPGGNVARAVRTVALRIGIFYVCSVFLITAIVPWNTLVAGSSPFNRALDIIGIPGSAQIMSVIILTAVLSCLNSGLYITSRMLYELGRKGDGPPFLQRTARNQTPIVGIVIGCVSGAVAALSQLFLRQDVFTLLAGSSGAIALFNLMLIALAQIRRRRQLEAAGAPVPLKMWLFPWLSYAVVAAIGALMVLFAVVPEERVTLVLSSMTVIVVLSAWRLCRMRSRGAAISVRAD